MPSPPPPSPLAPPAVPFGDPAGPPPSPAYPPSLPPPSAPVTLLEALAAAPEGSALADASESLGSIQDDLDNLVMATFETTLTATGDCAAFNTTTASAALAKDLGVTADDITVTKMCGSRRRRRAADCDSVCPEGTCDGTEDASKPECAECAACQGVTFFTMDVEVVALEGVTAEKVSRKADGATKGQKGFTVTEVGEVVEGEKTNASLDVAQALVEQLSTVALSFSDALCAEGAAAPPRSFTATLHPTTTLPPPPPPSPRRRGRSSRRLPCRWARSCSRRSLLVRR